MGELLPFPLHRSFHDTCSRYNWCAELQVSARQQHSMNRCCKQFPGSSASIQVVDLAQRAIPFIVWSVLLTQAAQLAWSRR